MICKGKTRVQGIIHSMCKMFFYSMKTYDKCFTVNIVINLINTSIDLPSFLINVAIYRYRCEA